MTDSPEVEHGVVCELRSDRFGYFGWPSVGRMEDGTLVAVASGMRSHHVGPYGRTVFFRSEDEGATWTGPRVITDSPFDDRDAGVVSPGGRRLVVSWFTSDTRHYLQRHEPGDEWTESVRDGLRWQTDENAPQFVGAWLRTSDDAGDTWNPPRRVRLTAPHGPIVLADGDLFYLGKEFGGGMQGFTRGSGRIMAMKSPDEGRSWQELGEVPLYPDTVPDNYHEAHVAELPDGRLLGHIRFQSHGGHDVGELGLTTFSIMQTVSTDGGRTWSEVLPLGFHGSPPHLMVHSSDRIVCTYGYRREPYGQRACVSEDGGKSWTHLVLRDDGPDSDLGYPSSVELSDGSIFTLYYQKPAATGDRCGLLWTRWRIPD